MQFDDYMAITRETAVYPKEIAMAYLGLGLTGEAGEVANKVKKIYRDKNGNFDDVTNQSVAGELGDVLWYLARLADEMGLSLNDLADANVVKLRDRKARNVIAGSGDNR